MDTAVSGYAVVMKSRVAEANMTAAANNNTVLLNSLREILTRLLDAIEPADELLPRLDAIKQQVDQELKIDHLVDILRDTADLFIEMWRQTEQERREWNKFLHQLTERLHEFDKAIQGAGQQTIAAYYGGRKVESALERQVGDIESRLHSAATVEQMKAHIHQRVAVIRSRLEDNQGKEAQRFSSLQAQLNKLATAIREIEQQSAELRRRYEQAKPEVLVDPVTGVASHLAFEQRLEQEFARWKRYKSPLVVQLWGVDGFKALEQAYGRKVADKVLQLIAKIMGESLRETDFIARYDGERFAVLLLEIKLDAAQWVTDRLCRAIANQGFHHRGTRVEITASCGYAAVQEGDTPEILLQRADGALDQATAQGRGRYCAA